MYTQTYTQKRRQSPWQCNRMIWWLFGLLIGLGYCHEFYQEVLYLRMDLERLRQQQATACRSSADIEWSERIWLAVGVGSDYRNEDCEEYERKLTRLPIPNPLVVAWDMMMKTLVHPLVPVAEFIGVAFGKVIRHHNLVVQIVLIVVLVGLVVGGCWWFVTGKSKSNRTLQTRATPQWTWEGVMDEQRIEPGLGNILLIKDQ